MKTARASGVVRFAALVFAIGAGWLGASGIAGGQTAPVPDSACASESTFKSTRGDVPASLQVINKTTATVQLIWLDYDGKRVFYSQVPPLSTYIQPTWLTHPWVVADLAGTCYRLAVMNAVQQFVTIEPGGIPTPVTAAPPSDSVPHPSSPGRPPANAPSTDTGSGFPTGIAIGAAVAAALAALAALAATGHLGALSLGGGSSAGGSGSGSGSAGGSGTLDPMANKGGASYGKGGTTTTTKAAPPGKGATISTSGKGGTVSTSGKGAAMTPTKPGPTGKGAATSGPVTNKPGPATKDPTSTTSGAPTKPGPADKGTNPSNMPQADLDALTQQMQQMIDQLDLPPDTP